MFDWFSRFLRWRFGSTEPKAWQRIAPQSRFSFWLSPNPEPLRATDHVVLGSMAASLLADPMLNAILAGIGERYRVELEQVKLGDVDQLQLAHMRLHVLNDFVGQLRARIGNAKLETRRVDEAKQRAARSP